MRDDNYEKLYGQAMFGAGAAALAVSLLQELGTSWINRARRKAMREMIVVRLGIMVKVAGEWKVALEAIEGLTIRKWQNAAIVPTIRLKGLHEAVVARLQALSQLLPSYKQSTLDGFEQAVEKALVQATLPRKTLAAKGDSKVNSLSSAEGSPVDIDILVDALKELEQHVKDS